jgi:hypothetical protein
VTLLALKVVLVPGLVASVTLAGRRWGPGVGGLLAALPLAAGPILVFLALEQGTAFAARAAVTTMAAVSGVAAFAVAYAWMAVRAAWPPSLLTGLAAFAAVAVLVPTVPWTPAAALLVSAGGFAAARVLLPAAPGAPARARAATADLWPRMLAALLLVLITTSLAPWLGPELSGVLAPFPVVLSVLAAFTHAREGAAAVLTFLHGFLPSMTTFSVFCFVVAVALEPLGIAGGFALALGTQAALQALLLPWLRRR